MATPTGSLKSSLFRATTDGRWIFRSPNPWVFGDTPHYLVNDAQKTQIEAIITPKRPVLVVALYAVGLIAWAALVATFLWAFSGHPDPTPGDTVLMVFLILVPAFAALPLVGVIKQTPHCPSARRCRAYERANFICRAAEQCACRLDAQAIAQCPGRIALRVLCSTVRPSRAFGDEALRLRLSSGVVDFRRGGIRLCISQLVSTGLEQGGRSRRHPGRTLTDQGVWLLRRAVVTISSPPNRLQKSVACSDCEKQKTT